MYRKLFFLFFLVIQFSFLSAKEDSICGTPLKYQVLTSNEPTEGFYWMAGNKRYDVYYKGADLILEQKKKNILWLITGGSFNPSPGTEMYIDTMYFQNTSESPERELVIGYSLFSMRPDNSGKSKHLAIIDLRDKVILLNITTYDHRLEKDENGKFIEYLYECDVDLFHDGIRVTTSEDSDINDARTQLDDGIYTRKGHCYVFRK
jgi:hypothetical protein